MLEHITPVLLTYNEAPNIARTLAMLDWAADIVVVDSGSSDDTVAIAAAHPNVRIVERKFDQHATQWNYAIHETGVRTPWVFALDADYVLTRDLVNELAALDPPAGIAGYATPFQYCVFGEALRGSVYPTKVTLFRREAGRYEQDGHTQRLALAGKAATLRGHIRHDDRKSFARWLVSQAGYMKAEAAKLTSAPVGELSAGDRIRRTVVLGPIAMWLYCYFVKKNILDGRPGAYYALQRTIAELILSAYLIESTVTRRKAARGETADHLRAGIRGE